MPRTGTTVAVIGGGVMGSAAAWQLAVRGHRVVVLEQYEPGHDRGASHGSARIFRHGYPVRSYVDLAARASRLWRRLERLDGARVYTTTGAVDHGDPDKLNAIARVLSDARIEHSVHTPRAARLQWPGLVFDTMVLYHPHAGRLHADNAVAALQRRAAADGAEIRHHTEVTGVRASGAAVTVLTASGSLRFDHAVIATGAWTPDLLAGVPALAAELPPLRTTQEQPVHFIPAGSPTSDSPSTDITTGWPSFIHHPGAVHCGPGIYGLASADGIKLGEHGTGPVVHPRTRDHHPRTEGIERLQRYASRWLPGVDAGSATATTCLYTTTPDHHFVVDRRGPITVAAGFSGHGFKFAPAIGELVAGLVQGTSVAPRLFALGRRKVPLPVGRARP